MSQVAQGSLKRAVWPAELSGLWTKTSAFVSMEKGFTNALWHQIINLYWCFSCPWNTSGRIYLNLRHLLFPRDNVWKENIFSFHNFGIRFLT